MALLHEPFLRAATARPGKTALVAGSRRIDYGTLLREVQSLSMRLRAAGVAASDRVAVFVADPWLYAVALHAVLLAGATFVPVSAGARAARVGFIVRDVQARLLLSEQALHGVCAEALAGTGDLPPPAAWPLPGAAGALEGAPGFVCWTPGRPAAGDEPAPPAGLAAILYTSGTTGVPKGVMLSHANMAAAWALVQAYLALREDDVIALPLAPTFSYGLYHLLMGLGLGATVVLEPAQAFPRVLLQRLADERATVLPGVPMLFSALLGVGDLHRFDLGALRIVTNAAAALPPPHLEQVRSRWPQARFFSMYGMTECKRISYLPPEELGRRPGSVGRGMAGQRLWLVDEAGTCVEPRAPAGGGHRLGELAVSGPHVMVGYWQRPVETAERLQRAPDGAVLLRTGDLFSADEEGFLHFVARQDDIIKTRGEKVAPREVENVLCALAGVREAAVVGVPDEHLGEAVKAFVVPLPGSELTARTVIRHCLASLEPYMAPKHVEFVRELPQTESGKVRRTDLREPGAPENPRLPAARTRAAGP